MPTYMLIVFVLFLFACKPSPAKPDTSLFENPATPVAVAAQQCIPPTSKECGPRCFDPKRSCCCKNPNSGGICVIGKISEDQDCGEVCDQCQ